MLKRLLSGSVYVALIVGFLLLRRFVNYRLFDILTFLMCSLGTFEVARALKEKIGEIAYVISVAFGILYVPLFYFSEMILGLIRPEYFSLVLMLFVITLYTLVNAFAKEPSLKKYLWQIVPILYPSLLLTFLLLINRNSLIDGWFLLILTFVVSPATDTFAYLVGLIYNKIRKGKAKKSLVVHWRIPPPLEKVLLYINI